MPKSRSVPAEPWNLLAFIRSMWLLVIVFNRQNRFLRALLRHYVAKDYRPTAVMIACVTVKDIRYLLMVVPKQHRKEAGGNWKFAQGGIRKLEDPVRSGRRELFEETELELDPGCEVLTGGRPWHFRTKTKGWRRGKVYFPILYLWIQDSLPVLTANRKEIEKARWFSEAKYGQHQILAFASGLDPARRQAYARALDLLHWRKD